MLNLTFMLSGTPAKVVGAKLVKGRAMSGSKDSAAPIGCSRIEADVERSKKEQAAKRAVETKAKQTRMLQDRKLDLERRFRAAMLDRGWLTTEQVVRYSGLSKSTVLVALAGLIGTMVERKEAERAGTAGTKYLWRWL